MIQFASNLDKYYLESLEELKNTSDLFTKTDNNNIDLSKTDFT